MKLVVDGLEAYAYEGGKPFDPALPCIVFVHGALHDHSAWTLLARWFAHHGHGVLAVDLPGHARSTGDPPESVEAAADWLLRLLDAAGVARAAIVGHSMGSLIALETAARAPERVTRIALVGSTFPMKVSEALLTLAREAPLEAIDRVNAFSISTLAAKPSFPAPGMWLHGSNRALMRRTQALAQSRLGINLFSHDFGVCDRYAGGLAAAAKVGCPVTMVLGARDQMTPPKSAREFAAALRAEVVLLDAGHSLMAEVPDALLGALRSALGRARDPA
ncbi:MAG: alpha/beta hydrolase [Burkholderiales bacterium]|nr:alpha/beta hydrolase [Burkholderiales bacterium]MDE2455161.1 alpha/beta hydrolase [Burkholderiales bacterium]